jgi:hypothetical protein
MKTLATRRHAGADLGAPVPSGDRDACGLVVSFGGIRYAGAALLIASYGSAITPYGLRQHHADAKTGASLIAHF